MPAAKLDYRLAADALSNAYSVPPTITQALIGAESGWNPRAVSSTGATGLGQFIMSTGKMYGLVGDGFDHRTDAALNMTAVVLYLRDLHKTNPTWREVIGHYSGQGSSLSGYAGYPAGQMLIAAVDACDGSSPPPSPPPPPPAPDLPPQAQTIVVDSMEAHDQATGSPVRFVWPAVSVLVLTGLLVSATCCSKDEVPSPPAQKPTPLHYHDGMASGFDWSGSTFVIVPLPKGGFRGVPLR